jgi:cytochrome P450
MQEIVIGSGVEQRTPPGSFSVAQAGWLSTMAVLADVLLPTLGKGVIMRRPWMLAFADRFDLDRRAIRRMQVLRRQYGCGPLLLRIPGRSIALILDTADLNRVLAETPDPFATATREKTAALAHFEPKNVLLSQGLERADRRRYHEEVLASDSAVHPLADRFIAVVDSEVSALFSGLRRAGELAWSDFAAAWFRIVRRILFGDAAAGDRELSGLMATLRRRANWAFLAPQRPALREHLLQRIRTYIDRSEPGSLAEVMAHTHQTAVTEPAQQAPQWLFAVDPAGMATFRTLALLGAHRDYARTVRAEIYGAGRAARSYLPNTRAAVLEALRLWPTTPLILRETSRETTWAGTVLPAATAVTIFTPFFHRDSERQSFADRFAPQLWPNGEIRQRPGIVPFSDGPGICPGRNLVLLLASAMIAAILHRARVRLKNAGRLAPDRPLPATLNHFGLRFEVRPAGW